MSQDEIYRIFIFAEGPNETVVAPGNKKGKTTTAFVGLNCILIPPLSASFSNPPCPPIFAYASIATITDGPEDLKEGIMVGN